MQFRKMKAAAAGAFLTALAAGAASAQTAITYQGEIRDGGQPADGTYDLRFKLFDAAGGGSQVGTTLCADNVAVVDGRFTIALDFGAAFAAPRFLEIDIRRDTGLSCGSAVGFITLTQRQTITSAPSATHATTSGNASNADLLSGQNSAFYLNAANLTGTLSDARLSTNVPRLNTVSTFTAIPAFNGGVTGGSAPFTVDSTFRVTNLNSDLLDGLDSTSFALASHTHDAGAITSGTLLDARLSANIGRLNGNQNWTGSNVFSGNNSFSGDGSGLTSLNAGQLVSGQVPDSRLPATVARLASANTFTNAQTISTSSQFALTTTASATGGTWSRITNTSIGGREWGLISTGSGNGEGAGKFLIRDGTAPAVRMAFDTDGDVGIGTVTPAGKLDITGADPRVALRNANDPGGGFVQNTFGAVQVGLYNPGASAWNAVPANGQRSMFGVDSTGRVGSLTNTGLAPTFRNILDDGSGNASIQGNLTARNLPAVKETRTIRDARTTAGWVGVDGTFVNFDSITVNVPGSGFLVIEGEAQISQRAGVPGTITHNAWIKIEETTGTVIQLMEESISYYNFYQAGGESILERVAKPSIVIPTSAGVRSFRLVVTDGAAGIESTKVGTTAIRVTYYPAGL